MTDRELLQQALDALEWAERRYSYANLDLFNKPIEAIRTRLAQPNPINKEPTKLLLIPDLMEQAGWVRKKEWVGLTDEEVHQAYKDVLSQPIREQDKAVVFNVCRAIEAKLKEKNT